MKSLIIRSASLERLDFFMADSGSTPEKLAGLELLTHPHAAASIRTNYPEVKLVEYPFSGGFNRKNAQKLLRSGKLSPNYEKIIVLAGNLSGKGYHNVCETAFALGKNVWLFNINGELLQITAASLLREKLMRLLLSPLVISGTLLLSTWGIVRLLTGLFICRKRETGHGATTG